ncbi:hypothetical protein [Streptomyces sp. PSKA30]|uniref:hypothetical protein n=1 Tax=Streptomyces sp. PSKA30 TaxID=2874597 RepID=UPI001CD077DA|nr:hypothetical protein [Streptomyces sp. PSKA30]MBZ9643241.1 hypothetical protein [Streptomyces sp. PSKA30]
MSGTESPQERPETGEQETQQQDAAGTPVRNPVRRGRLAAVAGCLLLAGALIAGVGATVVTVRDADRDAGAPRWKFPKATAEEKKAPVAKGLAGVLVPYGTDGWAPGPDIGEFGADAQLNGAQATALRKESLRGLPRSVRKELEKQIDRQRIKGMAMRSYFSQDPGRYWRDGIFEVTVQLAQMENRTAVRDISRSQRELLGLLGGRKGPKIKGHEEAECFRTPEGDHEDLDMIFCSAYVGDVLVTATADGAKPLDTDGVAQFLRTQLDRIAEPGKAI